MASSKKERGAGVVLTMVEREVSNGFGVGGRYGRADIAFRMLD